MDPEIKQEFEKMSQKTSKEIEDLTLIVKEGFDSVESRMATKEELRILEAKMATKDDIRNMATKDDLKSLATKEDLKDLEVKMDAGFSSLWSELKVIKEKISALEKRLEKFMQTESEDVSVCYEDLENLKTRVARIEKELRLQAV